MIKAVKEATKNEKVCYVCGSVKYNIVKISLLPNVIYIFENNFQKQFAKKVKDLLKVSKSLKTNRTMKQVNTINQTKTNKTKAPKTGNLTSSDLKLQEPISMTVVGFHLN